jgi:hypothetical protein
LLAVLRSLQALCVIGENDRYAWLMCSLSVRYLSVHFSLPIFS